MASAERFAYNIMEEEGFRSPITGAIKQLLLAGNSLLYVPPKEKGVRVFKLDTFVIERDPMGNILLIITKESLSPILIKNDTLREQVLDAQQLKHGKRVDPNKSVDLFTQIKRVSDNKFEIVQEIGGILDEDSRDSFTEDELPWIPLRYTGIDGESYGSWFC